MSALQDLVREYGQRVAIDEDQVITDRLDEMYKQILADSGYYKEYQDYFEGKHTRPHATHTRRLEVDTVARRSVMNLIPLAVSIPSQLSFVEGFRRGRESFPKEFDVFVDSGFRSKQTALFKSALKFGSGFVSVENLGKGSPEMKLLSARETICFYDDPVNDRFPAWGMTVRSRPRDEHTPGLVVYYDAERITYYDFNPSGAQMFTLRQDFPHDLGVTPIRRFTCELDDEGVSRGIVEQLIPAQDRVNQASFDLTTTQSFSAFKVKWTTGVEGKVATDPETGEEMKDDMGNPVMVPIPINPTTFLQTTNSEARFGTLDETPLDGFIESLKLAVQHFAVQGQLPPHALLGNLSNLSAETLVAAMSQTQRLAHILKTSWAQGFVDLMELVAIDLGEYAPGESVEGLQEDHLVNHYPGEVRWADMSDHTLAAIVDALGKGAQMLDIPARGLWSMFPGVSSAQVEEWERLREDEAELEMDEGNTLNGMVQRGNTQPRQGQAPSQYDAPGSAAIPLQAGPSGGV